MTLALDNDGTELAQVAARWLTARAPSSVVRTALEAEHDALPDLWTELVSLGWIGLAVPERLGGQGAGLYELAVVVEQWGLAVAPGPFPGSAAVATVLGRHAPELVGPVLAGEPAAIVSVGPTGAAVADGGAVAEWFLWPDASGTRLFRRDELEVRTVRSADPTRRPALVALPDTGAGVAIDVSADEVVHLAAVVRAAEATGVAGWCVETAASYARDRVQFGRPIGHFQGVKHRCADALCRLELARAVTWDAARADGEPLAVAAAAALAPAAAFDCAKDAIQVLGGIGYTWEHDAHLYLRRATLLHHFNGAPARWRDEVVCAAETGQQRSVEIDLPPEAEVIRAGIRREIDELTALDKSEWNERLADGGWISPHWPRPWGRDAGPVEQLVIDGELRAAGVRRPHLQVAGWVLPTLIAHGSPAQQDRFMAASLRHEISWCQLFSEPGAGSDLASLSTRAERVDGGWSITGQKVWTTMAAEADWGICLARTDPEAAKHDGITCFLVDMSTPGIDVRPLRELTGFAMFNEVFLDGVVVADDCVVGAVNDGWRCARTTLENERVSMASGSSFGPGVMAVMDEARRLGVLSDPLVRDVIGQLLVTSQALAVLGLRGTLRAIGGELGPEASVRKLVAVEHEQRTQEVGLGLLGPLAAVDDGDGARWFAGFLGNRALSIAGGTSEIQRNVIAERLLGLPRD